MRTITRKNFDGRCVSLENYLFMEGKRKSFFILLAMIFIINNNPMLANGPQKGNPEDTLCSSVGRWHPKMFYVVLPDISLSFILPYEPDQSGVHNLFFISKESGEILLLDTIKDNRRYFTPFSSGSCYDVVLLYNNGKYVKYNDMIFETGAEVDMSNQRIQPSDSVSEHWKTMRAFDDTIEDQASDNDMAVSDFIIKGYVFGEIIGSTPWATSVHSSGTGVKKKLCAGDGYFEIDIEDDTEQTLSVFSIGYIFKNINITASCGLFLVMNESPANKEVRLNPHLFKATKRSLLHLLFNPEEEAQYVYQTEIVQDIKQSTMDRELLIKETVSIDWLITIKRKNIAETEVQFTWKDVSYLLSSPILTMGYDSKKMTENPNALDKMHEKILSSVIGKSFILSIAPDGSVNSVSGVDAIVEGITQAVVTDGEMGEQLSASMISQWLGEDAIKGMIEQSLNFCTLLGVKTGDYWKKERKYGISNKKSNINVYTLESVQNDMATITMAANVAFEPAGGLEGTLNGTQSGDLLVDTKTGIPALSTLTLNMKGTVRGQVEMQMEMITNMKTTIKEILFQNIGKQ